MGITLHELAEEFVPVKDSLEQMLLDGDIDDQAFTDTIDGASMDIDLKIENVAKFIQHLDNLNDGMATAVKSISDRKKAVENRIGSLKKYLSGSMDVIGYSRFERSDIRLSFRKSSSVVIDDESKLEQFKVEKIVFSYPKAAIKKAIEAGEKVDGAHIQENKNLVIK